MQFSILIVSHDVGFAATLQGALHGRGVPTYFAMNRDRARRALDELEPDIVLVDHDLPGAQAVLGALAASHPDTIRLLMSRVRSALFSRDLASGLIHGVVFEHTVADAIGRLASDTAPAAQPTTTYAMRGAELSGRFDRSAWPRARAPRPAAPIVRSAA